jgi:hypothetical protein
MGLVGRVELAPFRAAEFPVEDDHDLWVSGEFIADGDAQEAKKPKTPVMSLVLSRLLMRAGKPQ